MMKSRKMLLLGLMLLMLLMLLTACVPGDGTNSAQQPAGFFSGVWHGWIAPITLVLSLFNRHINIYEVYNIGFWYDFGFYMALSALAAWRCPERAGGSATATTEPQTEQADAAQAFRLS